MSVSKATAVRRAEARVLRVVRVDLERARAAGCDVANILKADGDPRMDAWRRGIGFAIERVRLVAQERRP